MQALCVCVCVSLITMWPQKTCLHLTSLPPPVTPNLPPYTGENAKKATRAYGGFERVPLCVYGARVQNTGNKQKRMHNRLSCASAGSIIHSVRTAADRGSSRRQNKYQYFQFKSSNGAQRAQLSLNAKKHKSATWTATVAAARPPPPLARINPPALSCVHKYGCYLPSPR